MGVGLKLTPPPVLPPTHPGPVVPPDDPLEPEPDPEGNDPEKSGGSNVGLT